MPIIVIRSIVIFFAGMVLGLLLKDAVIPGGGSAIQEFGYFVGGMIVGLTFHWIEKKLWPDEKQTSDAS